MKGPQHKKFIWHGGNRTRALFASAFSLAVAGMLLDGVMIGRFEDQRYFGTVALAEHPIGFVAVAALHLLVAIILAIYAIGNLRPSG